MVISSFEAQGVRFDLSSKEEIANISAPGPQIKKVKTIDFLKLLKLKKRKCSQFFYLWPRSRDIAIASFEPQEEEYVPLSREKRPISRPLGHKLKQQA